MWTWQTVTRSQIYITSIPSLLLSCFILSIENLEKKKKKKNWGSGTTWTPESPKPHRVSVSKWLLNGVRATKYQRGIPLPTTFPPLGTCSGYQCIPSVPTLAFGPEQGFLDWPPSCNQQEFFINDPALSSIIVAMVIVTYEYIRRKIATF